MILQSMNLVSDFSSAPVRAVRDGFGDGLVAAGQQNPSVIVLTADLKDSVRASQFASLFPDRFIDCGVAEQAMITIASGLANTGKIPIACSFAAFSPGRTWEQIRTTIALNDMPVIIGGLFGGVSVGQDGATHQMLEDIALMRVLPNMIVIAPADALEAKKAVLAAVSAMQPTYIRVPRVESTVFTTDLTPFAIGKANLLNEGNDITLIACGVQVYTALTAARQLELHGITCDVINLHTIKPLDSETLLTSVRKTNRVITIEDHQIAGGLGGAVCEVLADHYPARVMRLGIQDVYGQSGKPDELYAHYGLTAEHLMDAAHKLVGR